MFIFFHGVITLFATNLLCASTTATVNSVKFTVNDMSGRDGYRSMWESMYGQCDAIVFVVDSTDQMRFAVVKDELDMLLRHPDVADRPDLPILFAANKTAAPDACGAATVAGALRLHEQLELNRPWRLASTDAVDAFADDGLHEAMEWLVEKVAHRQWCIWLIFVHGIVRNTFKKCIKHLLPTRKCFKNCT